MAIVRRCVTRHSSQVTYSSFVYGNFIYVDELHAHHTVSGRQSQRREQLRTGCNTGTLVTLVIVRASLTLLSGRRASRHGLTHGSTPGCRKQPPRFQVCRDALGHEAGMLHRRKVRRGLAKGDEARRGARQVRREEVAVEGGPRPTWLGLGLG